MKTKLLLAGYAASLLFLTAGCQNTVNTVENTDKTMTPNTINDTRFVTDGFLKDRLALKKVDISTTTDGFMRVQLEAVNVRTGGFAQVWSGLTGDNPYDVDYKFDWFDQRGMQVKTIMSNWKSIRIVPGETVYIQGIAPTDKCRDFKISLKEANN